jgi:hypothetical protein
MFVSVTRLRIRSLRFLPSFAWMAYLSQRQIMRADGFSGGRLCPDAHYTFWTITVWDNERAMKAYRGAEAHGKAMRRLPEWCDEASYVHWEQPGDAVPSLEQAWERMQQEGRLSRVAHPSADHEAKIFARPKFSPAVGRDLKPVLRQK